MLRPDLARLPTPCPSNALVGLSSHLVRSDAIVSEEAFRQAVRDFIRRGEYPLHVRLRAAVGRQASNVRTGLTPNETRWRAEEMGRAGFDWELSKASRSLIRAKP